MLKTLAIDLIEAEAGTQMRAGTRLETVNEYADLLRGSKEWPFDSDIVVFADGDKYYLADGFHRYAACKAAGRASLDCDIRKGGLRDAIKYALGANQNHGLRRTNEDKRTAVEFVLKDAEWGGLSSRAIAEMVGVSHVFIEGIRTSLLETVSSRKTGNPAKDGIPETRIGKDGKNRPAKKPVKQAAEKVAEDKESEPAKPDEPKATPTDWKFIRDKARKTAEAMMRALDDLDSSKPNRAGHSRCLAAVKVVLSELEGWK